MNKVVIISKLVWYKRNKAHLRARDMLLLENNQLSDGSVSSHQPVID